MIVVALILATGALLARRLGDDARRAGFVAPRRHALVASAVATGTILVVMTEALGCARLLTPTGITIGWAIAALAAAMVARRTTTRPSPLVPPEPTVTIAIAAVAIIAATTGLIAVAAPPNTWDSMTYHMSRVVQWQSHASVAHYPTNVARQVLFTPGAEFALLHLQLAWGSDRLANLLQWSAFVGVSAGASLVAARLGADARGQVLAAFVCATAPIAILESSSTQNDLVGAFWLLCFAYFTLLWRARPSAWVAVAAGASLGLAVLTKMTVYVIALPWLAPILMRSLRAGRSGRLAIATTLAVALALNAGTYARHLALWRAAISASETPASAPPTVREPFTKVALSGLNAAMSPSLLVSNVLRNVGLQVALPWAPARTAVDAIVSAAHSVLGVDPGDPRTTYPAGRVFRAPVLARHEDLAPNPLHLALVIVALALLVGARRWDETARQGAYVAAAFVLFCCVFKWQPWHTRLHLPLFVLAAPVVAVALAERVPRVVVVAVGAVLLVASLPWIVTNQSRPLVGSGSVLVTPRADQYFADRPDLRGPYRAATIYLRERSCRDLGLVASEDDWEYPLWALLADDGAPLRIEHVEVANETRFASVVDTRFVPCAVVAIGIDAANGITLDGRELRRVLVDGPVQVLAP